MAQYGAEKKRWVHTGATGAGDPCPYCQRNIDLGFVDIDYLYESVFGPNTIPGPPAHPQVDHCHIEFDEEELIKNADKLKVWDGGDMPADDAKKAPPAELDLPELPLSFLEDRDMHEIGIDWDKQAPVGTQAYGGVIFDDKGRVLLRKPTGGFGGLEWTFPKGKWEGQEHPARAALREVLEETGHEGAIVSIVPGTYKGTTSQNNYFLMRSKSFDKSKIGWETEDLRWATLEEAIEMISLGTNKESVNRDLHLLAAAYKENVAVTTGKFGKSEQLEIIKTSGPISKKPVGPTEPEPATRIDKPGETPPAPGITPEPPITKPEPEPPPPVADVDFSRKLKGFPDDLSDLREIRRLPGSTGAKLVEDPVTGKRYVWKEGRDPGHLMEEMTADAAYQALGVKVPRFRQYKGTNGQPVKLSEFIEDTETLSDILRSGNKRRINSVKKKIQKDFAADALLGNWDVTGLEFDNILIDKKGNAWRIDNGGALRRRAQGDVKRKSDWNEYPVELWSLRGKVPAITNKESAQIFGDLKYGDILKQINSIRSKRKRDKLLSILPGDLHATIRQRLSIYDDISKIGKTFQNDRWKDEYIDSFTQHSVGYRRAGVIAKLPEQLKQIQSGSVWMVDETGRDFDRLRGRGSIMIDVHNYINENGGDSGIVRFWMNEQAGSSWSNASMALKYYLHGISRDVSLDEFYWQGGADRSKEEYNRTVTRLGVEKYQTTMAAWHAFNYEFVRNVAFPRNNRRKGVLELIRTEDAGILGQYGLKIGDKGVTMLRGGAESASIYSTVVVSGSNVLTTQLVPYHRIFGNYFFERTPGANDDAFYGDRENEFIFMAEGLPFDIVGKTARDLPSDNYWK